MKEQFDRPDFKETLDSFAHVKRIELSPDDYEAWYISLSDLPLPLVQDAMKALVRESDSYMTPATVRARAKALAVERAARAESTQPPPDLDGPGYVAWLREETRRKIVPEGTPGAEVAPAAK